MSRKPAEPPREPLPIDAVLPELLAELESSPNVVLQAPPGAGKTTRVPLALLGTERFATTDSKIVMLEPRRVAARAAASRLAGSLGEPVGRQVGWRMRDDTKVSAATRIEVVTEGVLTRMLQSDPSLEGIGTVIFDEFHERSVHADLGLALALEAQSALRPDLQLVVMSATLDGGRVAAALGGADGPAPLVSSRGRQYPVQRSYRPPMARERVEDHLAAVVAEVHGAVDGDVLCFLPGAGWIDRAERKLRNLLPGDVAITPLYGRLSTEAQDRAIQPDPAGRQKVILATDIAETSLTIDGVRLVVDGGQRRTPQFDPRSGLSRLTTVPISKASADQREGRAGRQAPGTCIRLWSERDHQHLRAFDPPEIASADLTALRLELARWGARADELTWLDAPPPSALAEAEALLTTLGAIDDDGRITTHGEAMGRLGTEPRFAHMLVRAHELGMGATGCDVAAVLGSNDAASRSTDLRDRVKASAMSRDAKRTAKRLRRRLGGRDGSADPDQVGIVVSLAFPDRIGQQRGRPETYRLSSGRGAQLATGDPLTGEPFLAVAEVDGDPQGGRVYLAAPIQLEEIAAHHLLHREPVVTWDADAGDVVAEHRTSLGALVFKREPISHPPAELLAGAWAQAVAAEGLSLLPFDAAIDRWRHRVALVRRFLGDDWPDLGDGALLATTEEWLAPHLHAVRRRKDLAKLDVRAILGAQLDWKQQRRLDEVAPTHFTVPSGSNIPIDYSGATEGGTGPVLAVRIQELFGLSETPRIVDGAVPLVVHLLSPAQRPMQVTTDLANFWATTYPQVKSELMGRYPKHHWPDDPLTAQATNRTKKRR